MPPDRQQLTEAFNSHITVTASHYQDSRGVQQPHRCHCQSLPRQPRCATATSLSLPVTTKTAEVCNSHIAVIASHYQDRRGVQQPHRCHCQSLPRQLRRSTATSLSLPVTTKTAEVCNSHIAVTASHFQALSLVKIFTRLYIAVNDTLVIGMLYDSAMHGIEGSL